MATQATRNDRIPPENELADVAGLAGKSRIDWTQPDWRRAIKRGLALVLKEVGLLLVTAEAIRARSMRLPLERVELWWAGAFEVKKASGGIGFFVGGLVPVGSA